MIIGTSIHIGDNVVPKSQVFFTTGRNTWIFLWIKTNRDGFFWSLELKGLGSSNFKVSKALRPKQNFGET